MTAPHQPHVVQAPPQAHVSQVQPHASSEIVPQRKHEELMEQYARLSDRFKRIVEERDALSRQVTELRKALTDRGASSAQAGEGGPRDYKEEIRLLGKLIDDEQSLRAVAIEKGVYKPGEDPYARHDKLVSVFLNIVGRTE
jgi:hypothetical protein